MESIRRVTPFLTITASSSLVVSSKVKPYWKPEHPPALNEYSEFEIRVAFLVNQFFNFEAGGIGEDNGVGEA